MARSFPTTSDYIQCSRCIIPPNNSGSGTISCWLKPNWSSGDNTVRCLWGYGSSGGTGDIVTILRYSDNNIYYGFYSPTVGDQRGLVADTGIFSSGTWLNVALTYNYSGPSTKAFKNGVVFASTSSFPTTAPFAKTTELAIGRLNSSSSFGFGQAGTIADWCSWRVELSRAELLAIANGISPKTIRPQSILAYYPLNEAGVAINASGSGQVAIVNGSVAQVAGPPKLTSIVQTINRQQSNIFMPPTFVWSKKVTAGAFPSRYYYDMNRSQHV